MKLEKILLSFLSILVIFIINSKDIWSVSSKSSISNDITTISVGSVSANKVVMEIIEPHLNQWKNQSIVSFKARLINKGSVAEDMMRYRINVITPQKTSIPAITYEKNQSTIVSPGSSMDIPFYAVVNKQNKINDVKFEISEWNIDYPDFKKYIGKINVSPTYNDTIPARYTKTTFFDGVRVQLAQQSFYINNESKNDNLTIGLLMKNQGNTMLRIPDYTYYLKSNLGELYELKVANNGENTIEAKEQHVLQLYLSAPKRLYGQKLQLVVGRKINKDQDDQNDKIGIDYIFNLTEATNWNNIKTIDGKVSYSTVSGNQFYIMASEQIFTSKGPTNSSIAMKIKLMNKKDTSVDIPEVEAFFFIDGKKYETKYKVESDKSKLLPQEILTAEITSEIPPIHPQAPTKLVLTEVLSGEDGKRVHVPFFVYEIESQYSETEKGSEIIDTQHIIDDGISLSINIKDINQQMIGGSQFVKGNFVIENNSTFPYKLSNYKASLTIDGITEYLGEVKNDEQVDLQPGELSYLKFEIKLPPKITIANAVIQLKESTFSSNDKLYFPVAKFIVHDINEVKFNEKDMFILTTSNGDFQAKVNSTYRLPMEEKDLIVSELELDSSNSSKLSPPVLAASYQYNQQSISQAKVLSMDNTASTNSNQKLQYQVIAEVPYSTSIEDLNIFIEEEGEVGPGKGQIKITDFAAIPEYNSGYVYEVGGIGNRSNVKVNQVVKYSGANDDLIEVQVGQQNQDKRNTKIIKLVGYLIDEEGIYYPLELEDNPLKLKYSGTAVISASTKIPKGSNVAKMKLLVGQAVSDNKLLASNGEITGYVKAAIIPLVSVMPNDGMSINNMTVSPYILNIFSLENEVKNGISVQYRMQAELIKAYDFDHFDNNHQIVVELSSDMGDTIAEEFTLNSQDGKNNIALGVGEYNLATTSLINYRHAKIYLKYRGYKILLGTKSL